MSAATEVLKTLLTDEADALEREAITIGHVEASMLQRVRQLRQLADSVAQEKNDPAKTQ